MSRPATLSIAKLWLAAGLASVLAAYSIVRIRYKGAQWVGEIDANEVGDRSAGLSALVDILLTLGMVLTTHVATAHRQVEIAVAGNVT